MIIAQIAQIAIMILIGLVARKSGYVGDYREIIGKVIVRLTLPLLIITSLSSRQLDARLISGMIITAVVGFFAICIMLAIAYAQARLLKFDSDRRCVHICLGALGNVIFLGFPLIQAALGYEAIFYATIYAIINDIVLWTFGIYIFSNTGENQKISLGEKLEKLVNPSTVSFVLGFLLLFSGIKLPEFIAMPLASIGGVTTPLSMIFIGMTLAEIKLKGLKGFSGAFLIICSKMVLIPLAVLMIFRLLEAYIYIEPMVKAVTVLQIAMPVQTITTVLAKEYNRDLEYASACVVVTTTFALLSMPTIHWIISNL